MSLFKKKVSSVVLILTLLFSSGVETINAFADSNKQITQTTSSTINNNDVESANKKIDNTIDKLINYLDNKNVMALDDNIIDDFFQNQLDESEKITDKEIVSLINKSNQKTNNLKIKGYSTEDILQTQVTKSVVVNDSIKIEVLSNGIFTVEELTENGENEAISILAASTTQTSSARKDYYSWVGIHIFTVSAIGTFTYNGSICTLNSGTNNSYIKRGTLSIWGVSNQSTSGGSRGTSAYAKISANLHIGFAVGGGMLTLQDLYVMHEVLVDKAGKVTRTMTAV
ncbi:hypothetical protein [Alkalithermobacter paradoxus]|uniref:Uncharacterized protein n=1 Tax=Alkalithermobacter paradoxus TaxID=29349 RepID=A0A1V4I8U8_9FIRM|nr:hypothetical protein CLOTH_11350 [[Clostridium] thermoalcaliphilum]